MSLTKIKPFSVTSVNFTFILNVTILIIQTAVSSKQQSILELHRMLQHNSSLCSNKNFFFCCTNTDNNSTHWIDLENDHNSPLSLKSSSNLELLVLSSLTMLTLKIVKTQKKFVHSNIMTLRKCTTLKYLTKINRSPLFI